MKQLFNGILMGLIISGFTVIRLDSYAIYFDADSDIDKVNIEVYKSENDRNKMLDKMEIGPQVKYWLVEAGKVAGKIIAALANAQAAVDEPSINADLQKLEKEAATKTATAAAKKAGDKPTSKLVTISKTISASPAIIEALWSFLSRPINNLIRMHYAVAYHSNVPKGNRGKRAEWNYKDIAKELKMGDPEKARFTKTLYMVVTSVDTNVPLLQGSFYIGGAPRFSIKANPDGTLRPVFKSGFVRTRK